MNLSPIGLILCHDIPPNPNLTHVPKNVRWTYELNSSINKFGYRKFDYVVNHNCYTYSSDRFFDNPYSLLKPDGIYIHLDGIREILNVLGLSYDLWLHRDPSTVRTIKEYMDKFAPTLGFNQWKVLPNSTDILYSTLEDYSDHNINQDILYNIGQSLDYQALVNLCRMNRKTYNMCFKPQFRELLFQAWIKKYPNQVDALIDAFYQGNFSFVDRIFPNINHEELLTKINLHGYHDLFDYVFDRILPYDDLGVLNYIYRWKRYDILNRLIGKIALGNLFLDLVNRVERMDKLDNPTLREHATRLLNLLENKNVSIPGFTHYRKIGKNKDVPILDHYRKIVKNKLWPKVPGESKYL